MDENNDAKLYIDGSYKGTVEGNNQGDPGTTSFLLGSTTMVSYNVLDQLWGGTIDNVRISSTVRSEEWIKLCYENQKVGQTLVTFGEIVQGHVYPQTCGANENMKVDGQIKCNSLLIHDWLFSQAGAPELPPDYVFTKGYNLQSLKEIEEYVKKHGHLPGIPSEEELRKNGVDMIQLNFMLLKKIEEMILHMIRQEKEIEELKKAVK